MSTMDDEKSRVIRKALSTDDGMRVMVEQASSVIPDPEKRDRRKTSMVSLLKAIRALERVAK